MQIEFEHGKLFYNKTGNGGVKNKTLLLFHGVGQDHTIFNSLVRHVQDAYSCYTFDLFFHGQSEWKGPDTPLTKQEWKKSLNRFFEQERIDSFDVLGYSIGGRLALATVEAFPEKTDNLYMIAGEGLRKSFWYSWATHPVFGQRLFRRITKNPSLLITILKVAQSIRIIPATTVALAITQLKSSEKRMQVYGAWILLSKLEVNASVLNATAEQYGVTLHFLFGAIDEIMSPSHAKAIQKQIPRARIDVVNTSHAGLIRNLSNYLKTKV
jgi:pimeloyl-ACP methyl ester carboxylesterase